MARRCSLAARTGYQATEPDAPTGLVIVVSLVLALAVVRTAGPLVPRAIAAFTVVVALFDLLEVVHQLGQTRTGLAAIAVVALATHVAAGFVAVRLLLNRRSAMSAGA